MKANKTAKFQQNQEGQIAQIPSSNPSAYINQYKAPKSRQIDSDGYNQISINNNQELYFQNSTLIDDNQTDKNH